MNYVISYWAPSDISTERESELRKYFDLQRYLKSQFGAEQIIVTNLDYPGAIQFVEPAGFQREHGILAKLYGLGQLIEGGLNFPIALHDHDMFIRQALPDPGESIICCSRDDTHFSDQLVVFPESSKDALLELHRRLNEFDFEPLMHIGYGSETRHEGMASSETVVANMRPYPFAKHVVEVGVRYRDLVSFDIRDHHSLDPAECECAPIPKNVQAVHGHLNKGPATEALIDWLAQ